MLHASDVSTAPPAKPEAQFLRISDSCSIVLRKIRPHLRLKIAQRFSGHRPLLLHEDATKQRECDRLEMVSGGAAGTRAGLMFTINLDAHGALLALESDDSFRVADQHPHMNSVSGRPMPENLRWIPDRLPQRLRHQLDPRLAIGSMAAGT